MTKPNKTKSRVGSAKIERRAIRPSEMSVDHRYQRELDERRARAMSRNIEPALLGTWVLSQRPDGSLVIIDAQHRHASCVMAGYDEPVFCEVHIGLELHEEAQLFYRLNNSRSAVKAFSKFKSLLAGRDPETLKINAIVHEAGLRVTPATAKRGVCAVQALYSVFHRGNLPAVLSVLVGWADGDPSYLEGQLLRSLSMFLSKYPDVDLGELTRKLAPIAAERVLMKLRRARGSFSDRSPTYAACEVFVDIYNDGRGKRAKLPRPDYFVDKDDEEKAA